MNKPVVQEQYVDLAAGRTFVRMVGSGRPALVIHGGRGMEHSYLVKGLSFLGNMQKKLYFYDQLGAGRSKSPIDELNLSSLSAQLEKILRWIARHENGAIEIIAHSWGTHLFLSTFMSRPENVGERVVFISPMALTRPQQDEAMTAFWNRIRRETQEQISNSVGVKTLRLMAPYYLSSPTSKVIIRFADYNSNMYEHILREIDNYNVKKVAQNYLNAAIILGEHDFLRRAAEREFPKDCKKYIIAQSGHFAFAEQPGLFEEAMGSYLASPFKIEVD
jgi:proline iminopeptidase